MIYSGVYYESWYDRFGEDDAAHEPDFSGREIFEPLELESYYTLPSDFYDEEKIVEELTEDYDGNRYWLDGLTEEDIEEVVKEHEEAEYLIERPELLEDTLYLSMYIEATKGDEKMLYEIDHIKSYFASAVPTKAKMHDMHELYYIYKTEECFDILDCMRFVVAEVGDELTNKGTSLASTLMGFYRMYEHEILRCFAVDYMIDEGYDTITAEQMAEIDSISKCYSAFFPVTIGDFLNDVEEALYEDCIGNGRYGVNTKGEVKNLHSGRKLKNRDGGNGYWKVRLFGIDNRYKNYTIHRLVALAFCEGYNPATTYVVNHMDEDKHNNRASNLEWCTPKYNRNYSLKRKEK